MELESSRHSKNSNLTACLCPVHPKRLVVFMPLKWQDCRSDPKKHSPFTVRIEFVNTVLSSHNIHFLAGDGHLQTVRKAVCNRCLFFWNEKKTWHLWKKATESHPLKMIPVHLVCSFQARPLKHWHVTKHACQLQVTCHRVSNPTLLLHAVPLGDRAISAYRSTQVDLRSAQWRGLRG